MSETSVSASPASRIEFDFEQVFESALGALDLGAKNSLTTDIHANEQVGVRNEADCSVESPKRYVCLRKKTKQLRVVFDGRGRWKRSGTTPYIRLAA